MMHLKDVNLCFMLYSRIYVLIHLTNFNKKSYI